MFKRLFVLVLLALATLSISTPASAEAQTVEAQSCAHESSRITSMLASDRPVSRTAASAEMSDDQPAAEIGTQARAYEYDIYYYSDASYTVVVGSEYINECTGYSYLNGVRTAYRHVYTYICGWCGGEVC